MCRRTTTSRASYTTMARAMAEATPTRLDSRAVEAWKRELEASRPDTSTLLCGESGVDAYSAGFGRLTVAEPASFACTRRRNSCGVTP